MNSFLYRVASYLYSNHRDNFRNIRVVFPNRRSGVFFLKHLASLNKQNIWLPEIITINEFIEEQSKYALADQVELLVELYKIYQEVTSSQEPFNDFYFWGEIMLNDFNDIDKYNINADAVFSNVRELKNIDSGFDYLTDEQKLVLKRFFQEFDPENNSKLKENFLQVWNFLLPIYNLFNENLRKENMAYEGMLYKNALNQIRDLNVEDIETQYYFVGFNAITKCEEEIFTHMQKLSKASFFWDYDNYYLNNSLFEAGYFMRNYINKFLSPDDFEVEADNLLGEKQIKVVSIPTNTGQVAYAGRYFSNHQQDDYSNSALVLADELLLQPALNYLPTDIEAINITMGYPVNDTLAGNFIELILKLKGQNKGKAKVYYYKNVLPLLKHPYIATIIPEESATLIKKINTERIVSLSHGDWESNELLDELFRHSENSYEFAANLLDILSLIQEQMVALVDRGVFTLDFEQLYNIYLLVNKLKNQLQSQNIDLSLLVFLKLLRKMIYRLRIPFEGEPVKGLQVMGFLETRNLDFENLVILSVNDSLLPTTNVTPSFVPYSLRKGFGLPTRELHDAMYAYYFYRIIQRASNVVLVYNSGTSGLSSGDKSRFIHQLLFDSNFHITEESEQYTIELSAKTPISVSKKGLVKQKLDEYLLGDKGKKISPSALVTYLTCPLKFYYQQLLRLRDEDELTESVDARLFGNIFHHAAENVYMSYVGKNQGLTEQTIKQIIDNKELVDNSVQKAFDTTFFGEKVNREFEIKGKNLLVAGIIKKYLFKMLQIDMASAPITILSLEGSFYRDLKFQVNGKDHQICLGGHIDRLDKTGGSLRIIDYKTGGDKLNFKNLEEVFDAEKISDHKAIVQTLIYALVCVHHYPAEERIIPGVYKVKEFFKAGFNWKVSSKEVEQFAESNFLKIENEVANKVANILSELFDCEQPFVQTKNEKHCEYCSFKTMCGK